jgi:hypothetical protein
MAQLRGATVTGRVLDASTGSAIAGVRVGVEGRTIEFLSDSGGYYRLVNVPAGPQVLQARRVGFALARVAIVVPSLGTVTRDIELARVALQMREVRVSADRRDPRSDSEPRDPKSCRRS